MRLLLVEDNERFAELLKRGLTAAGFVVDVIGTAAEATEVLETNRFEVVVLDLGLPDADGLDVLTEMRRRRDATPVLILTARGSLKDRVNGLGSGADDYLVKPFALEELIARLRALLRRPGNLLGVPLELGNVTLDTVARQVFVGEEPIFFSPREIAVLEHLLQAQRPRRRQKPARRQSLWIVPGDRLQRGRGLYPSPTQAAGRGRRLGSNPHIAWSGVSDLREKMSGTFSLGHLAHHRTAFGGSRRYIDLYPACAFYDAAAGGRAAAPSGTPRPGGGDRPLSFNCAGRDAAIDIASGLGRVLFARLRTSRLRGDRRNRAGTVLFVACKGSDSEPSAKGEVSRIFPARPARGDRAGPVRRRPR